jgi:hypothetical protein
VLPVLATLLASFTAQADIHSFNAAVQTEEERGAMVVAGQTRPMVDLASPSAALVAHEFACVAMLAGESAAALLNLRFQYEQGKALPHPDPTPALSHVLLD